MSLAEAVASGELEYIAFPEALKGKYQAFTQANLDNLRKRQAVTLNFVLFKKVRVNICTTFCSASRTLTNEKSSVP